MVTGGKKIRIDHGGSFVPPEAQRSQSQSKKRSAKSLADSDPSQPTIEQCLKLPKKKAKRKVKDGDL